MNNITIKLKECSLRTTKDALPKLIFKVLLISFILFIGADNASSQQTSRDGYQGLWTTSTSWAPTWATPVTTGIAQDITIFGYITHTGDISFGGNEGDLIIEDTLVINGNLILGNNNNLSITDKGILIVNGNVTVANKVDISTDAYIIISGDFTKSGSESNGSFTSTDSPSNVFIGGTVDVPGDWGGGAGGVLNCSAPNEYDYSGCNYGNATDLTLDPISSFFETTYDIMLSSNNPAVAVGSMANPSTKQTIYKFTTTIGKNNVILNSVTFTTSGTVRGADISRFQLWYSTTDNLATATAVKNIDISFWTGSLAGTRTFSGLSLSTNTGATGYFWITVDVRDDWATNGRTISVNAITTDNLTYTSGIKAGTAFAGGTKTIGNTPNVEILSSNPSVSATNVLQGTTKQRIYKFTTTHTNTSATLTAVSFTTAGTYAAGDITRYQLWYNDVNSMVDADPLDDVTVTLEAGIHTFSGFSQTIAAGNTGYFWITADIKASATPGHTISVNALTATNLTFSGTVNKSAITFKGGIQTIQLSVDSDNDGVADLYDLDDDNDGLVDTKENDPCNTTLTELFPNTNFNAGNTGFSSAYNYIAPAGSLTLYPEGLYTIVTNPKDVHNNFIACGDHTTGTGNMMVVNATGVANAVVWSSGTISVTPYTDYTVSFWLATVSNTSPAKLIWNVNGENIGVQFDASASQGIWNNAQATWNSGSLSSARFEIINLNTDANGNDFALDDISCTYRSSCDADGDLVPDQRDIDSDNDGIYDVLEAGGTDSNFDGIIDGFADVDHDGLSDNVDNINSGRPGEITNGTPRIDIDTDSDGRPNRIDTDSDADLCFDVTEAGFTDADNDGKLGVTVDGKGKVTGAGGYTTPANADSGAGNTVRDYLQQGPVISTQPVDRFLCVTTPQNTTFSITATNTGGTYQWEYRTSATGTWANVNNGGIYSGATTATLTITGVPAANDGYQYRVLLRHTAYKCSPLISNVGTLRAFNTKPVLSGAISGYSPVCPSVTSAYSITAVPATLSYTWTYPTGWTLVSGAGTNSVTLTSPASGTGNITVTANNTCGTSNQALLAVNVVIPSPTFIIPAASVTSACTNTNITYTTESGKSNYVWTIPTGVLGTDYTITSGGTLTDNTITINWITTGSRTVSVNYSSGGCTGVAVSKTLTVNPVNTINLTSAVGSDAQTRCINTAITEITYSTTGATGATFSGLPTGVSGNWVGDQASISGTPTEAGIFPYTVTLTGGCGTITTTGSITVNNLPTVAISISESSGTASNDGTICNGDAATLTASGGDSYSWSPATGLNSAVISNPLATPSSTTTYTVTVTDVNGCVNTANRLITVVPKPTTGEFYRKPNN